MAYHLIRKGYGEFATGTFKELFQKARHEARLARRSYKGTNETAREVFFIENGCGEYLAKVVCKPQKANFEEGCLRTLSGRPVCRYYY